MLAGEHTLTGFANHDLARRLHPHPPANPADAKRCAATSRLIAKLRGHGLVRTIPHRRRYRPTRAGLALMTAIVDVHDRDLPNAYLVAA